MSTPLTPKAERTRNHILDTALTLFRTQGYETTTLRDIAAAAECSLGLTYRYFARKEDLVLVLYSRMVQETNAEIAQLPPVGMAERFQQTMSKRLEQVTPYRDSVLFRSGTITNPTSDVSLFGEAAADMRQQTLEAFVMLVRESRDAPRNALAETLAALLYSLHFGIILFWLIDRSAEQQHSKRLLEFSATLIARFQPLLSLPLVSSSLNQLAAVLRPVFVGES